jgi:mannosyltransferase
VKPRTWRVFPLLALAFGLRLWRLDAQSLWWDEIDTVFLAVSPPSLAWDDILRVGNQVPLYYLLLRPWTALGHGEFWIRYPSVWWGVLTVALTFRLGHRLANRRVGAIAAGLLSVLPFHIWYSQEARAYSMLAALVTVSYFLLSHLARRPCDSRRWVIYGVTTLAILYTHYFGTLLLLAQAIPILAHWRRKRMLVWRWLKVASLAALALVLWMAASQVLLPGGFKRAPIDWIDEASWYEPLLTFHTFGLGSTAYPAHWWNWLTCAALLIAFIWGVRRQLDDTRSSLVSGMMVCWPLVPIVMMWLLSVRLPGLTNRRSIYMDRYVTWLLPVFALLVARGWDRWRRRHWSAWGAAALYAVTLVISLGTLYTDARYGREDWRSAVRRMNARTGNGAVLISRPVQRLPLWYYPPSDAITVIEAPDSLPQGELDRWLGISSAPEKLWLITARENTNPHGFPQRRNRTLAEGAPSDMLKTYFDARYPIAHRLRFPGVLLTCYRPPAEVHNG